MRILGYAFLLVVAVIMVAIVLGFPVFRSNYDESRRRDALGCYYLDGTMVMEATANALRLPGGTRLAYSIWTDKTGLAILPAARLRLISAGNAGWRLAQVAGRADLLRFQERDLHTIELDTIEGHIMVASKRPCATATASITAITVGNYGGN